MALLQPHQLQILLDHLTAHAPDLLPTCRWLLVDPRLTTAILGPDTRPPSAPDLARFLRFLRHAPPEAAAAGNALLAARARIAADLALERLLAAAEGNWHHPTEILAPHDPAPSARNPGPTRPRSKAGPKTLSLRLGFSAGLPARPCPDFAALHAASLERLESRNGDRRRLETVRDRLELAARLEATARRRREGGS